MAEIQSQQQTQKHGGVYRTIRNKKLPIRVDLTPMVDLGFLLITFFVFTTSLSQPKVMSLALPSSKKPTADILLQASKALTLVLAKDNKVGYYNGDKPETMLFTNYDAAGIRKIIQQKQAAVKKLYGDPQQMMVLIKPSDECTYKNVVETLDEMLISDVKSYMLVDVTTEEQHQVNRSK